MQKTSFEILSFNIHKGFSSGNLKFTLGVLKEAIQQAKPDLICLQEVQGYHVRHKKILQGDINFSQIEYLAEGIWPHLVYGKNAIYTRGHHGNAILSRYPIRFWENQDISVGSIEKRGLLHAAVELSKGKLIHIICSHLGLFETDRSQQIHSLCKRIDAMVPKELPLIVAGDFNDWRQKTSVDLKQSVGLSEAFLELYGSHARTFPAWFPVFSLDRVYFRGMELKKATCMSEQPWDKISDHLALLCQFAV